MTIMSDHSLPIGDSPLIHWDSSLTLILNETETETETQPHHVTSDNTATAIHQRTSLAKRWEWWWMVSCQRKTHFGSHRWWTHDHWRSLEITENHWESLRITGDHWKSQSVTECHSVMQTNIDWHSLTQTPREEYRGTWTVTSCPCDTGWWMALGGDSHGHWVSRVMSITRWLLAWESSELNDTGGHSLSDDTHWMMIHMGDEYHLWWLALGESNRLLTKDTDCWHSMNNANTHGWWPSLGGDYHWVMTTMNDKDHWSLVIDPHGVKTITGDDDLPWYLPWLSTHTDPTHCVMGFTLWWHSLGNGSDRLMTTTLCRWLSRWLETNTW